MTHLRLSFAARFALSVLILIVTACSNATPTPTAQPAQPAVFTLRDNLAAGQPAEASSAQSGHEPAKAVDGLDGYDNSWVSDGGTPQWIQVELGGVAMVDAIELMVSQPRTTSTHHLVYGITAAGEELLLAELNQQTSNNEGLVIQAAADWLPFTSVKIETLSTPSLSAWQEIQVFGTLDTSATAADAARDSADLILYNGIVLSMDADTGEAQAIAIQGEHIVSVGSDVDILALANDDTLLVDLAGQTVLPGFIDTHSHLITHPDSIGESHETIQDRLFSEGITTIAEMGIPLDEIEWFRAREADGELLIRVSLYPNITTNCGEDVGDGYLDAPREIDPDTRVDVPGVKAFADGGSCGAPAVSFEYADNVGQGDLWLTQDEMNALVQEANDNGYQIAVHALGDRAASQVLEAFFAAGGSNNTMRNRIEHNAVVSPDLYARYGEVNPVAILFGYSSACIWGGGPSNFIYAVPEELADWEWPYGRLLAANPGLISAWHGDVPIFPLSTSEALLGLTTRQQIAADGSVCQPPAWMLADTVSTQTALEMMTINAAYALWRDDSVGNLVPGKLADLIVLPDNPLTMAQEDLGGLHVLMTMVGGETVYCEEGAEAYCP